VRLQASRRGEEEEERKKEKKRKGREEKKNRQRRLASPSALRARASRSLGFGPALNLTKLLI
jgi:hypothetical protein